MFFIRLQVHTCVIQRNLLIIMTAYYALAIINYLNDNTSEMGEGEAVEITPQSTIDTTVNSNDITATEAVTASVVDEFLRVRENQIGLSYFTGGSQDVVEEDSSELESTLDELADDVFGQW